MRRDNLICDHIAGKPERTHVGTVSTEMLCFQTAHAHMQEVCISIAIYLHNLKVIMKKTPKAFADPGS